MLQASLAPVGAHAALALRAVVIIVCIVGLYVSSVMLRKYVRARQGRLDEPSVVTSPRAKIAQTPNALIGLIYYALMLAVTPFMSPGHPIVMYGALTAASIAALSSLYLAYSLLFVTRMPCRNCWTGHIINWSLLVLVIVLSRSP